MAKNKCSLHPVVIFWLGVLTGALLIGLIFTYKTVDSENMTSSFIKRFFQPRNTQQVETTVPLETESQVESEGVILPGMIMDDQSEGVILPGM